MERLSIPVGVRTCVRCSMERLINTVRRLDQRPDGITLLSHLHILLDPNHRVSKHAARAEPHQPERNLGRENRRVQDDDVDERARQAKYEIHGEDVDRPYLHREEDDNDAHQQERTQVVDQEQGGLLIGQGETRLDPVHGQKAHYREFHCDVEEEKDRHESEQDEAAESNCLENGKI
jgi:hypothetical protein